MTKPAGNLFRPVNRTTLAQINEVNRIVTGDCSEAFPEVVSDSKAADKGMFMATNRTEAETHAESRRKQGKQNVTVTPGSSGTYKVTWDAEPKTEDDSTIDIDTRYSFQANRELEKADEYARAGKWGEAANSYRKAAELYDKAQAPAYANSARNSEYEAERRGKAHITGRE